MNLVDRYLTECIHNRKFNWMITNLYIERDQPYSPTFGQQEILLTRDNQKAFLLPRGAGSTTVICMDAITEAMLNPMRDIIIICPNHSSCRNMLRKIANILEYSDIQVIRRTSEYILFENQSIIKVYSSDVSSTRGQKPDTVYIDNFDMINSVDLSNIFSRMMYCSERMLILGNNLNDYESTQRIININPREL